MSKHIICPESYRFFVSCPRANLGLNTIVRTTDTSAGIVMHRRTNDDFSINDKTVVCISCVNRLRDQLFEFEITVLSQLTACCERSRHPVGHGPSRETEHPTEVKHMRGFIADGRCTEDADEPGHRQRKADDECDDAADVDAVEVVVASIGGCGVHVADMEITATNEKVVHDHDANHRTLEDGIAAEEREETVGGGNDPPERCQRQPFPLMVGHWSYQGTMAKEMIRHRNCPRMMLMYLEARYVTSAAKGTILQAMDVPNVENANDADAKNTPARALEL